jgi:hypothetical protein
VPKLPIKIEIVNTYLGKTNQGLRSRQVLTRRSYTRQGNRSRKACVEDMGLQDWERPTR